MGFCHQYQNNNLANRRKKALALAGILRLLGVKSKCEVVAEKRG